MSDKEPEGKPFTLQDLGISLSSIQTHNKRTPNLPDSYHNPKGILSRNYAPRTHKTEAERAQGTNAKFSTLTQEGKAALKGKAKVNPSVDKKPTNRERKLKHFHSPIQVPRPSSVPSQAGAISSGSRGASPGSSRSASSCSYHSSISSGPSFSRPQHFTSPNDVKELKNVSSFPVPTQSLLKGQRSKNAKTEGPRSNLQCKKPVSPSQKSNVTAFRPKQAVKAAAEQSNSASSAAGNSANGGSPDNRCPRQSGGLQNRPFNQRNSSWGSKFGNNSPIVPGRFQLDFSKLKSVVEVQAHAFFPCELTLAAQSRLADLLDSFNLPASAFVRDFVLSRVRTDNIKNIYHCFLITSRGRIHFFNATGFYSGYVDVNEPVWFYGRVAGSSKSEYLSLGNGKTSRCFIKTRFPTLHEFISHDWAAGKSSLKYVTVYDPVKNRNWRGSSGFCWLPLYLNSSIPLRDYPTSGLVRLFTLYDKFGIVPIVKSGKYYHYDPNGKKHIKFPSVFVGAEPTEVDTTLTTWDDCVNTPFLRTAVDSVPSETLLRETSNCQTNLDILFEKTLNQNLTDARSNKIVTSHHLNAEEFELLKSYFGLTFIENRRGFRNPHSLLNTMRECFNRMYSEAFRSVTVSNIRGNLATTMNCDLDNTHICMPLINPKDVVRQIRSAISLFNSAGVKLGKAATIAKRPQTLTKVSYCNRPVPKCTHKSTAITMVDVYDISLHSLINAMEAKGALISRCCFMFPPELIYDDGTVLHPETSVLVTRSNGFITYHVADTSDSITHNVEHILSFLKTSTIVSKSGICYSVELLNQIGPYMDFQVSFSRSDTTQPSKRSFTCWSKNKISVKVDRLNDSGNLITTRLVLGRDFVRRVLSYSSNVCNIVDDRTYEYVLSNMRSQTTMMVVGSKIVHNKVELSNDLMVEPPATFPKESVERRTKAVETAKLATKSFKHRVLDFLIGLPGLLLSKLWDSILRLLPASLLRMVKNAFEDETYTKDCPDVVVTDIVNDISTNHLDASIFEDLLEAVKDLTLLSAPEVEDSDDDEITEAKDTTVTNGKRPVTVEPDSKPQLRSDVLRGGGNNWYDFLLPRAANKDTGSSLLTNLWRCVRKIDRMFRANLTSPLFSRTMRFLFNIIKVLLTPLHMLSSLSPWQISFKRKQIEEKKHINVLSLVGSFLSTIADTLFSPMKCYVTELGAVVANSIKDSVSRTVNDALSASDRFIKYRIASGLKALNLEYPREWLNERTKIEMLYDLALKCCNKTFIVPAVGTTLLMLLCSKRVRSTLFNLGDRAYCFIERVRIKRPILVLSSLLGLFVGNISKLSACFSVFDSCKEVCIGLLVPSLISSVYTGITKPSFFNKIEVLLSFGTLVKNYEMLVSTFQLLDTRDERRTSVDVADVRPSLGALELNDDTVNVLENFRANIKCRKGVKEKEKSHVVVPRWPESRILEVGESSGCKDVPAAATTVVHTPEPPQTVPSVVVPETVTPPTTVTATVTSDSETHVPPVASVPEERPQQTTPTVNVETEETRHVLNSPIALDGVRGDVFSENVIDEAVRSFNESLVKPEQTQSREIEVSEPKVTTQTTRPSTPPRVCRLSCQCGVIIPVRPFKAPGDLPLVSGDVMRNRSAWFYSRGGESYSYTGGSHKSRGWLDILDAYISACGLEPELFDHCLIQKYQPDSGLNFHKDDEPVYPRMNPVLKIHASGTGVFSVCCNEGSGQLDMTDPCYFCMPNGFQISHYHAVRCTTERVSLTFRSTKFVEISERPVSRPHSPSAVKTDRDSGTVGAPKNGVNVLPPIRLEPRTTSVHTDQKFKQQQSLMALCANATGVTITDKADLLRLSTYANMKHYVNMDNNVGVIIEAFLYNLHELQKEVSVMSKIISQPDVLIGKRRELYCTGFPDINRAQVAKNPGYLMTNTENSFYGSVSGRDLIFSNNSRIENEDSLIYLEPALVSFPLRRCLGMLSLMKAVSVNDVGRALVGSEFINAVPGAGKTFEIKEQMKTYARNEENLGLMLVLTSSKNAADSLNEFWSQNINDKKILVMTVDSFIFGAQKFLRKEYYTVLLDECYMSHAGLCILIAAATNPACVRFYGDRRQVPFINRNSQFRDSKGMLDSSAGLYTERLLTYRCPADICFWMSNVDYLKAGQRPYKGVVKTVADGRPLKSVTSQPFSPNELDFMRECDRVMTFTQMEKTDLINKYVQNGFGSKAEALLKIGTVAESQGETYARVALVRSKGADDEVFESFPHRLVALTRHTRSLVFVCLPSKRSKGIGKDVNMIEKLEDSVASSFVVQQHV
nr:methyltransferase/helicase [Grapevine leafroll-associated virus Carn]